MTKEVMEPARPPEKSNIKPKAFPEDKPAAKSNKTQIRGTAHKYIASTWFQRRLF